MRLLVLYFKRNRNEKGFGGATLSKKKIVLLWGGFHLLVLFFRVDALQDLCKF